MKVLFHCPVYNDACDTCKDRFKCLTVNRDCELWTDRDGNCFLHISIKVGRNCFVVEPSNKLWITVSYWHDGGSDINIKKI